MSRLMALALRLDQLIRDGEVTVPVPLIVSDVVYSGGLGALYSLAGFAW